MITPAITHQKHLAQSGRSTWSAMDIFNTLRVFTKQSIREQEIKLECMNDCPYNLNARRKSTYKILDLLAMMWGLI